jgi:hypothetical protein
MILETVVDRLNFLEKLMNTGVCASDQDHPMGERATHLLARPVGRPALALRLAGMSLPRCRFAPATRPNAPSGASNYGF